MEDQNGYNGAKNIEVVFTEDGSKSLYIPELEEHYHSFHGALQEAIHVFIKAGLYKKWEESSCSIKVMEIGFGTGLNCYLTYLESLKQNKEVDYYGIEAFPLSEDLISKLNYCDLIGVETSPGEFLTLHKLDWNVKNQITKNFSLTKIQKKIQETTLETDFDLIYFDAFGPRAQEEMWSEAILEKMYNSLNRGGILVTYCAKGEIKRRLKNVGFIIEALPGPPGKREMTRAVKI